MHEPLPQLTDPKDEKLRKDQPPLTYGEFLQRTRRYHKLSKRSMKLHYARGLDSKPEEMA